MALSWDEAAGHPRHVVATSPHNLERGRTAAKGRASRHGYDRARSAQAREPALHPHGGGGGHRASARHEPGAVHRRARRPAASAHPAGGFDGERVGGAASGGVGPRGEKLRRRAEVITNKNLSHRSSSRHPEPLGTGADSFKRVLGCTLVRSKRTRSTS